MPPLAAIVGSTGVGKSDFAIRIALELQKRKISAAIIGADAMQLYRGMDIGTAKIPISEAPQKYLFQSVKTLRTIC